MPGGRPRLGWDVRGRFWDAYGAGEPVVVAARRAGVSPSVGRVWMLAVGGVRPRPPQPRSPLRLSMAEREEISRGLAEELSFSEIGRRVGRPACTVSREVTRHGGRERYRAVVADRAAVAAARRPKPAKLAVDRRLGKVVSWRLGQRWSPQQIARSLRVDFPDDEGMRVSHETIYTSLYVQSRGALRRELTRCLRTGRAVRVPARRAARPDGRGRIPGMVMISERPAEAEDRAVPGHWEGDLILGKDNRSAIGTLVERASRYVTLLYLPGGRYDAATVTTALAEAAAGIPERLRRSVTWDQGTEMTGHARFTVATGIPVYFCDPHSPWQRGSNENTNGLLRQYFPKGTDLSVHTPDDLARVAAQLNARPRQTLGWKTPSQVYTEACAMTP
ncbi:IS30 family transposase [Frankia sp. R43]|uniref:IS30 family transposase n=1 Tax=Frankia sp. R43 TaxID=269536 RepID=UPI0009FA402D